MASVAVPGVAAQVKLSLGRSCSSDSAASAARAP